MHFLLLSCAARRLGVLSLLRGLDRACLYDNIIDDSCIMSLQMAKSLN
jgi:hypothetical protein